jgi:hypothetical protein
VSPGPRATLVLAAAVALCLLGACATPFRQGPASPTPKPSPQLTVAEVRLADPDPKSGAYRVQATIRHQTSGGPALITFRLRDRATGQLYETTGQVDLRPGVALVAVATVPAPPGDYQPEAVVRYPAL